MLIKFSHPSESHEHSLLTLELLNQFDNFMRSVNRVADLGCGSGLDSVWWATRRDPAPPHVPRNYEVYPIDCDFKNLDKTVRLHKNIHATLCDYNNLTFEDKYFDVLWAHNSLQYSVNPLQTLIEWHRVLDTDGMIYLSVPYNVNRQYNKFSGKTETGQLYHFMPSNIIYLLALAGFDTSDARYCKLTGDSHFQIVAYKDGKGTLDISSSWYDIADTGRLDKSAEKFVHAKGYLDDYFLVGEWFTGSRYTFDKQ